MAIKGARPEHRRITPHLLVADTDKAVDFYRRAFGAELLYLSPLPTGEHLHAHVRIADTIVMLTQEDAGRGPATHAGARVASPESLGGTTVIFELYVDDVDAGAGGIRVRQTTWETAESGRAPTCRAGKPGPLIDSQTRRKRFAGS